MDGMTWAKANWDRIAGWSLIAVGAVLLLVGAARVADAGYLADQLSFLMSAGLGGLGAVVLGSAFLITAGLHDEWRKLDDLEGALRDAPGAEPGGIHLADPEFPPATADLTLGSVASRRN